VIKQMEYFDIIYEELLENNSFKKIEDTFLSLGYKHVFVVREINTQESLTSQFLLPKSKKLKFHKLFLFSDLKLLNKYKSLEKIIYVGGNLKENTLAINNLKVNILLNPISEKLSFDEQSANMIKQQNKIVAFKTSLYTDRFVLRNLKQTQFIIDLLKIKQADFIFSSFARNYEELVDINILKSFLINFNLEEQFIDRLLDRKILLE